MSDAATTALSIGAPAAVAVPAAAGRRPADDMVWIPAGAFQLGSDRHYREEAPARQGRLDL